MWAQLGLGTLTENSRLREGFPAPPISRMGPEGVYLPGGTVRSPKPLRSWPAGGASDGLVAL